MFYVIQTNITLDDYGNERDFQNRIFQVDMKTWDGFKGFILNDKKRELEPIKTTMVGKIKPNERYTIKEVVVNDERHIGIIYHNDEFNFDFKQYYYLVEQDDFKNLLGK